MTEFITTVRFLVKQGFTEEFVKRHKKFDFKGMMKQLDTIRHTLEEISPESGVTDPASGPVVYDWTAD